ncbi:MAG: FtsQ-type POTRA domain-containing protein [Candidatus Terrybacteria bacterium]|nr:FtsQ-type POTRA domain-containing protein [Candidatus Terrybacteria bacterium]
MAPTSRIVYLREPRKPKHFPWQKTILRGSILVTLAALLGGALYLVRAPFLRVTEVRVLGAHAVSASAIEAVVREELSGNEFLVIPRDNLLFVSAGRIRETLAREFGGLLDIRVNREFPKRLGITVSERDLWGIACDEVPRNGVSGHCFYLDRDGTTYEEVSGVSGWLLPVIYLNRTVAEGASAVPSELISLFDRSRDALGGIHEQLLSMTVATATPGDVRLRVAKGWELLITSDREPVEWAKMLKTLLEDEIGERAGRLDYLDLRFGNKAFYKFR